MSDFGNTTLLKFKYKIQKIWLIFTKNFTKSKIFKLGFILLFFGLALTLYGGGMFKGTASFTKQSVNPYGYIVIMSGYNTNFTTVDINISSITPSNPSDVENSVRLKILIFTKKEFSNFTNGLACNSTIDIGVRNTPFKTRFILRNEDYYFIVFYNPTNVTVNVTGNIDWINADIGIYKGGETLIAVGTITILLQLLASEIFVRYSNDRNTKIREKNDKKTTISEYIYRKSEKLGTTLELLKLQLNGTTSPLALIMFCFVLTFGVGTLSRNTAIYTFVYPYYIEALNNNIMNYIEYIIVANYLKFILNIIMIVTIFIAAVSLGSDYSEGYLKEILTYPIGRVQYILTRLIQIPLIVVSFVGSVFIVAVMSEKLDGYIINLENIPYLFVVVISVIGFYTVYLSVITFLFVVILKRQYTSFLAILALLTVLDSLALISGNPTLKYFSILLLCINLIRILTLEQLPINIASTTHKFGLTDFYSIYYISNDVLYMMILLHLVLLSIILLSLIAIVKVQDIS